jgi:protoporphyrin/coproporphyrin ferrochelatase
VRRCEDRRVRNYDALLLVSFGGPEGPEDVVPFLENVTRGRAIPRERLVEVGEHYLRFGGRSPINDQNRALLAALRAELAEHAVDLPVYWGNRNWTPYLHDALRQMRADGVGRALCLFTSAYSSYSGCRQYRENLAEAVADMGEGVPRLDRIRHYFNHPGAVASVAEGTLACLGHLPDAMRDAAVLLFVTHSIPTAMNDTSGPHGGAYVAQHRSVADLVAGRVAAVTGLDLASELVYCSRSGPASQPWLEPDINDCLRGLAAGGTPAVVVVPIGFVSDHMEVRYDLDTEAAATAAALGMQFRRAPTLGTHPRFVSALRDLVLERDAAESGAPGRRAACGTLGPSHDVCPAGCCRNLRAARPALCGSD